MNAEIITVGTELLLGQIVDTNAAYMAEQLNRIGVGVLYKTTVGDNPQRMREVFHRALDRVDVVITSGGLGPTEDDLTREIAAEVTGRALVLRQDLLEQIREIFRERHFPFKENNIRQAYIPEDAIPIKNPQGTAPGYIIETDRGILLSLPGVPQEMKYLMQQSVLPYLKQKSGTSQVIAYRVLKLCGTGESNVDHAISDLIRSGSNPTIGLMAHLGQIDIRIAAKAETVEQANLLIDKLDQQVRERLPHQIFGVDDDTQESLLASLLRERGWSLAIAEANTGGHIAQQLMMMPEIEQVFRGGIVATDPDSLQRLLGIPADVIEQHGMVSPKIARQMAQMVKERCGTQIGLGITGYRQSREGKIIDPAIPVYIAFHHADNTVMTKEYRLSGSADIIQTRVKTMAFELLRRVLLGIDTYFGD